jgi:alpha-galactosidase
MFRSILVTLLAAPAMGYNNGVMMKPPMGWQTWCSVGPCGTDHCFDGQIRAMADTLSKSGMVSLGYDHIVLDDCWHPSRDNATGELVPFPEFFPNGMVPVIEYLHGLGIKFGLYTSVGDKTCHGGWSPGSLGHFEQDAQTFASWGVDYVKVDYCGGGDSPDGHKNLSKAMNATGRHMALELCRGPYQQQDKWGYAPEVAQGWRATGDHHDEWKSVLEQIAAVKGRGNWSKPYGWAYLDMMMTGGQGCASQGTGGKGEDGKWNWTVPEHCPGMVDAEYRTEASIYAIVASPILVGTDIRLMTPIMKELLLNTEFIAINQDYQATPGDAVAACAGSSDDVWARKLSTGETAVAITNFGDSTADITICFDALGWKGPGARVRDVWKTSDLGTFQGKFTAKAVASHDTVLVKLSPTA